MKWIISKKGNQLEAYNTQLVVYEFLVINFSKSILFENTQIYVFEGKTELSDYNFLQTPPLTPAFVHYVSDLPVFVLFLVCLPT